MSGTHTQQDRKQWFSFISCALILFVMGATILQHTPAASSENRTGTLAPPERTKTDAVRASTANHKAKQQLQEKKNRYRLPSFASPTEYQLSFTPDLKKFVFSGTEAVTINVLQPTKKIVMNYAELQITDAHLLPVKNESLPAGKRASTALKIILEPATQMVRFMAKEPVQPGTYQLSCRFSGPLNNRLHGFYRAEYEDNAHQKHWLASTDLEPADARCVFPCFDEPALKAVFRAQATIDNNLVAISNAPVAKEEPAGNGKKTVIFEASPRMSSYLFALIIGDLKSTSEEKSGNVPVRVWAAAGKEQLGNYALHEAVKILDFETRYFGVPYLGKKLDLIAIPEYTHNGMENVGAITFREAAILLDEKTCAERQRRGAFSLMAHEIAHQWFGDLVTMKWWDDLWLNEAFATWMAYKVTDGLHPEWRYMTQSIANFRNIMSLDSLRSTHAIHARVSSPSDAIEMFDSITYTKGSAVLRMLESFVGAEAFQRGITSYLSKHSFSNAAAEDFWSAIASYAGNIPVEKITHSYILEKGYPQVNVRFSPDGSKIYCSQYRKLATGQDKHDPSLWNVPLTVRDLSAKPPGSEKPARTTPLLLTSREQRFDLAATGHPIILNAGGTGYYGTCYDRKQLAEIQSAWDQLRPEEKLVLLCDCESLVLPGDVSVEDYFNFVNRLNSEKDPLICNQLLKLLALPFDLITDRTRPGYQSLVRKLALPVAARLDGWNQKPEDSEPTKELRASVLTLLGTHGQDKKTIDEAFVQFNKYLKDRTSVSPDLLPAVISIVTFNGGQKEYAEFLKLCKTAQNPSDHERALSSLPRFHQKELALQSLAMSNNVRVSEGLGLITGVAGNYYTRDIGWNYIKAHWNEILKRYPEQRLDDIAQAGTPFDSPEKEKEVIAWHATHHVPAGQSATARGLESMHLRVIYRQRYADRICKWVLAHLLQ